VTTSSSTGTTLGRHLFLAHRAVHDELDARLRAHGASVWTWVLLREAATAADHAVGASQRELAELMRIEPPTLVRHLDKLAEEGLVERRRDEHDRRVTRVVVTAAGRRRLAKLHDVVQQLDTELRSVLTTREVEVLSRALPRIRSYFTEPTTPRKEVPSARAI
jgi:MarR family transcriptional regulator, transcriptional regulator for hemolysin